jgi:acetyl-CoA synthetase
MAHNMLHWDRPFHTVRAGGFETGDIVWFPEGGLNASYNCVDRWAFKHPNKVNIFLLLIAISISSYLSDRHHLRSR